MGAEKWLDIEMWSSAAECFRALKSRGYRIATTHLGTGTVPSSLIRSYGVDLLLPCIAMSIRLLMIDMAEYFVNSRGLPTGVH